MKTINLSIKQIVMASFLTFLILGGNVSAKGTETGFVSGLENSVEPELKIEDWMVSDNYWKVTEQLSVNREAEKSLALEGWMTDENYWELPVVKSQETIEEEELKIDNWMVNEEFWSTRK